MASAREIAIAAASAKIVALLEELPSLWVTAVEAAQCRGIPEKQAAKFAQRLAATGRIEQRTVEFRAGRSRTRRRFEYRVSLPPDTPVRARLPAWLEPPFYPVDQRFARFVPGRMTNAIFKDKLAMTEEDIVELEPGVRAAYLAIEDEQLLDHQDVVDAKQRLAEAEERLTSRAAQAVALREQIAESQKRLAVLIADCGYAAQAVDSARENYRGTLDDLRLEQAKSCLHQGDIR
ncbi:hypothetical protein [Quatrionicoccus australiensis]|uniref:hypothetical protein n=1 Tax=Quatrionicoccus australiensis TaxID=138118 RepID=UPI001CF8DFE4|nr:hypothetical protein [Quatrionicoccus australiensis]UCV14120.1 hypothetical protein KI612_14370 [Quatrionicoccus australiensis]